MFRSHHDGSDDGDEGVAEGQQSVGGLGAAVGLSVGRTLHERPSLLHLLLNVVLYYVAVVVFLHRAAPPQSTALFVNKRQLTVGREIKASGQFPSCPLYRDVAKKMPPGRFKTVLGLK